MQHLTGGVSSLPRQHHTDRPRELDEDDGVAFHVSSSGTAAYRNGTTGALSSDQFSSSGQEETVLLSSTSDHSHDNFWYVAPSFLDSNFGLVPPPSLDVMGWNHTGDTQWNAVAENQIVDDPDHSVAAIPEMVSPNNALAPRRSHRREKSQLPRALENTSRHVQSQYSILSGEMDPYLLRYMRFSEESVCDFGPFAYRSMTNAEGPEDEQAPIQFLLSKTLSTEHDGQDASVAKLEKLVPFDTGARLVGL
jgi:hypothetical protein